MIVRQPSDEITSCFMKVIELLDLKSSDAVLVTDYLYSAYGHVKLRWIHRMKICT